MTILRKLLTYRIRISLYTTDSADYRRHGIGYWFRLYNELLDYYCGGTKK